jgi:endonuclease/exonuclease/phosphatase family metal-dependent hydrolase
MAREQLPETIRIATANFGPLDENKLRKPAVIGRLAQVIQQFDIVALQGIQGRDQGVLVQLRDEVNATPGRHYAFATAPRAASDSVREYLAFMFNADTVEIGDMVEVVKDRSGVLSHAPLVAGFRARKPSPSEAFTFKLINVQVSPDRVAAEVDQLAQVFRKVRDAYPEEDDIILVGDLETDNEHLGQLGRVPNLAAAAANVPTTTRGTRPADNILFDRRATIEYTGHWGVYDIMRECNLPSVREAVEISEHLPVWAEFSVYEGGPARPAPPGP